MEITRHFTVTTTIVHKNKVLLHLHKKLGIWIPIGGHIERDELPQEAAVREAKEESGLDVVLYNPDPKINYSNNKLLIRPMHIFLQKINEFHEHINFTYYAIANTFQLSPEDNKIEDLKWFTAKEIIDNDFWDDVKKTSIEAINMLEK